MSVLPNENAQRKTAVISGGAGGLGTALSEALQKDGWRVILIDRDVARLATSDTQVPMQCDLTDADALADCCAEVLKRHPRLDLVIYAAGVTAIAPVADIREDAHRKLFDVNYFAAAAMAQAFLPAVRAAKGTHLAITSVAGFAPLRHRATYAASKHAMTGFFASLRVEEAAHGVQTLIAAPAFVATNVGAPGRDTLGLTRPGSAKDALDVITADHAAAIILRGLRKGRRDILIGRVARLSNGMMRLSPRLYDWVMSRAVKAK